jgi:DNA polymerase III delta prime subunit
MAAFNQQNQDALNQYNADRITIYNSAKVGTDDQFWRNRRQMLEKVRLNWIKGFLAPSLSQLARMELGMATKPDAVNRPFDLLIQRPKQTPQPLPTGTPISQIFTDSGNALLILGEPGAGKTTLLLELTRDLLDRAQQDENHQIPVVFLLSSWAEHRLALADWLVDELNKSYDVPRQLAQDWVDADVVLPLLDGLDEVAADHREACVATINGFVREHGLVPLVVCSRRAEYEALSVRLRLPSAVMIQSLSRQQVQNYIEQAGTSLAGLHTVLHDDETLWELLNTPFMLSIMAPAYQGRSAEAIHAVGTLEERRRHVFGAYTDAMFHHGAPTTLYTREQTEHWLTWLAKAMKDHGQTIFYLEWMQPDWLPGQRQQRLVTFITSVMSGLLGGLSGGLFGGLSGGLLGGLSGGLFGGLSGGLLGGLSGGLSVGIKSPLVGGLSGGLSIGLLGGLSGGLSIGLLGGLLGGLLFGLSVGLSDRLSVGLSVGLSYGLLFGLSGGLKDGFTVGEIRTQSFPNEGIRRSVLNALISGLLFGLSVGLSVGLLSGRRGGLLFGLSVGLFFGLLSGLLFGLRFGGRACLHHFALRLLLWHNNFAPLYYVRFLDYATSRIFLHKVGGGYVFVHRMLLEYFSTIRQTSAEQQNCNRNG